LGSNATTEQESGTIDPAWKGLYKGGGLALILGGSLVIVDILVSSFVGGDAVGMNLSTEGLLQYIAVNRTLYLFDETLIVIATIPLIPGLLAIYHAVRNIGRGYALVGIGLAVISATLSIVAQAAPLALVSLSDSYTAALNASQRAVFVTAAEAVNALDNNTISQLLNAVGLLIITPVLMKSVLGKKVGYLALVVGILGLIGFSYSFVSTENPFFLFTLVLSIPWGLLAGYKLYRLGK